MITALSRSQQKDSKLEKNQARILIDRILEDAVSRQLLFPSACTVQGFTQHKNDEQQQFSVQTEAGPLFIKCQRSAYQTHFAAEQSALLRILETQTIAVCAPLVTGCLPENDVSYLVLQHIPLAVHGDWFSAGQQLSQMHSHTSVQGYGFDRATWCGETEQDNCWNDNWCDFFIHQRLQPLFDQLQHCGIHIKHQQLAIQQCHLRLQHHQPPASLLHGDLWSGNIGFNPDKQLSYPVLFDPSSYYGDAETDIAMTELFGRFPQKFYDGYQSISPLSEQYSERRPVYQLYHILNHALLFGGGYISQSESMILSLH